MSLRYFFPLGMKRNSGFTIGIPGVTVFAEGARRIILSSGCPPGTTTIHVYGVVS